MRGESGIRPGGSLPHRLRAEPFGPGPLCRFATSPHTVGSHPRRGGQEKNTSPGEIRER